MVIFIFGSQSPGRRAIRSPRPPQTSASRPAAGYDNGTALLQSLALAATAAPDDALRQVAVKTDFFTLDATIIGRDAAAPSYGEHALIDASQTPARVLSRSWGDGS